MRYNREAQRALDESSAGWHEQGVAASKAARLWREKEAPDFMYGLNLLPPAFETFDGFLVGEVRTHRTCRVSQQYRSTYTAWAQFGERYFVSLQGWTIPEFKALRLDDVLDNIEGRP